MSLNGALVLAVLAALAFLLDIVYAPWICLGIALVVAIRAPIAWSDCRRTAGLSAQTGGTCPECGADNAVRIWSL